MGVSHLDFAPGLDPAQLLFLIGTDLVLKLLDPFGPFKIQIMIIWNNNLTKSKLK